MSTIAGAFSETTLLEQRVMADAIMFGDRINQQFIPKYDVIKAIAAAQTANVITPLARIKDVDVVIEWINTCDIVCDDNEACVVGGTKASTNAQSYSLEYEKVVNFTTSESDLITNDFNVNEMIAKQLLRADQQLTECFAQYAVAQLNAFAGVNETAPEGKGDIVGALTYIQAPYWNPNLMAYFNRAANMNRFTSPVMLSGNNLYESVYIANANANNEGNRDGAVLYGMLPWYFDLFNVDTVNTPDYYTYMISMGAVAMGNKFYNPTTPQVVNGVFTRYTMPSRFLPGFTYDVFYTPACDGNDFVAHSYKVKLTADVFLNPVGCTETNTGVLIFACGTPN